MLPTHHGYLAVLTRTPVLALSLVLAGCSSLAPSPNESDTVMHNEQHSVHYSVPTLPKEPEPTRYKPIPAETLFSLMAAEMAGQRQQYDVALENYLWQAKLTRDPDIAERAARIAQFVGSQRHAVEALTVWLEEDPENPAAHQTAAQLLMEVGDFQRALYHLERVQQLTGLSQYDYLASNAGPLSTEQKQDLLLALEQLKAQQPQNASLLFAIGLMHQHLEQYNAALDNTNRALKIQPTLLSASLQKARILALLNRQNEALKWLADLRKQHPNHKGIQILRARILLEQQRLTEARDAFYDLHKNFPEDTAILLSLALLNEEIGNYEEARSSFYQLLANGAHTNEAHFYLGRMDDTENNPLAAINHFSQVGASREYLPAQLRAGVLMHEVHGLEAAREYLTEQREQQPRYKLELIRIETELLLDSEQYDDAYALLTQALKEVPESIDLLYVRAMVSERQNNLPRLENDLRAVLALNPQHIEALNALGYALADRTDRWQEALDLIQQAYKLAPDNAAIIDSLGWVYFRLGDIDAAQPLLERAFELMKDHEVAAHLGELLWITGAKQRALSVWQQGFEHSPDSSIIQRTLERLNVPEDDQRALKP